MSGNTSNNTIKPHEEIRHIAIILLTSLGIMVVFDQLVWKRPFGMQFFLLTLLILIGLIGLSLIEKKRIPWQTFLLIAPILWGATMTIIYTAGSTTFFNILLALSGLVLLALTFLNGQWASYRLREVLIGVLHLIQSVLIDPIRVLIEQRKNKTPAKEKNPAWRKARPYLLGVLIAIPLLLVLGALLASADLIFRELLLNFFKTFRVENIVEFLWRCTYILILAYGLAGAFIHALSHSADKKTINPDEPIINPFLGHVEAFIVLTLVNFLFLGFIIIQFRYFFAGEANISNAGFTYAEYARRGFFELVAVAIISLGIYYLLSMFTKRARPTFKRTFSALGVLLMLQVGIMIISAFQRLTLYEAAYGFTTLRTIAHIFMIWLGVLLTAFTLMEIFNQFKRLAVVLFLVFFGYTLTLNLLNVDRFIARRNIAHAAAGYPLDANYLLRNLSEDGLPALFEGQQAQATPQDVKDSLTAVLACRFAIREKTEQEPYWAGWNLSSARADALFEQHRESLAAYPLARHIVTFFNEQNGQTIEDTYQYYFIEVNGEEIWCMNVD